MRGLSLYPLNIPISRFEQSLSAMFFFKKPCQTKRLRGTTLHTFAREGLFLQLS